MSRSKQRKKHISGGRQRTLRRQVYARDRGRCRWCNMDCRKLDMVIGRIRDVDGEDAAREFAVGLGLRHLTAWHVHHRIPLAAGGRNHLANVETVCQFCHDAEHERPGPDPDVARHVAGMEIEIPEESPA